MKYNAVDQNNQIERFELTKDEIETVRGYIHSKMKGKIDSEILSINANYASRTRKAKKAPAPARGGAGGPASSDNRRSPYPSRTRRNRRGRREGV